MKLRLKDFKKSKQKIYESECQFFVRIKTIDKPQSYLPKEGKLKPLSRQLEKRNLKLQRTQDIQRIIRNYFKNSYFNKSKNLGEISGNKNIIKVQPMTHKPWG